MRIDLRIYPDGRAVIFSASVPGVETNVMGRDRKIDYTKLVRACQEFRRLYERAPTNPLDTPPSDTAT